MAGTSPPSGNMVFATCPSCKLLNHLTCPNCGFDDWFRLSGNAARCNCEQTVTDTKCQNCGATIPGSAFTVNANHEARLKAAPKTPAPGPSAKSAGPLAKLGVAVGGLILATAIGFGVAAGGIMDSCDCKAGDTTLKQTAYIGCKDFVKGRLKSPSSAKFPTWPNEDTATVKIAKDGDTYTVTSYVDADNTFGASIRSTFHCRIEKHGDKWKLLDLKMSN